MKRRASLATVKLDVNEYSMPERTAPSLAVTTVFEIEARAEALWVGLSLLFFFL